MWIWSYWKQDSRLNCCTVFEPSRNITYDMTVVIWHDRCQMTWSLSDDMTVVRWHDRRRTDFREMYNTEVKQIQVLLFRLVYCSCQYFFVLDLLFALSKMNLPFTMNSYCDFHVKMRVVLSINQIIKLSINLWKCFVGWRLKWKCVCPTHQLNFVFWLAGKWVELLYVVQPTNWISCSDWLGNGLNYCMLSNPPIELLNSVHFVQLSELALYCGCLGSGLSWKLSNQWHINVQCKRVPGGQSPQWSGAPGG